MRILLCVVGLMEATGVVLEKQPANFASMTVEQADVFVRELWRTQGDQLRRLLRISELFLDVPYGRDSDPAFESELEPPNSLIRLNTVDCTTFLEQSMAMARSANLQEAETILRRIRYIDGVVDYGHRKHFMMAQWIPMNQLEGYIEDITCRIGGEAVRWVTKRLDSVVWRKRKRKDWLPQLADDQIPVGTFRLPIIPRENILELTSAVPSGTILNIVRVDFQSIPYRVSHQGFVVNRKGKRYLRHAARVGYGRVVDEPLDTFLKRNLAYGRWPVEGVNLQAITVGDCCKDRDKTR